MTGAVHPAGNVEEYNVVNSTMHEYMVTYLIRSLGTQARLVTHQGNMNEALESADRVLGADYPDDYAILAVVRQDVTFTRSWQS